jgi:fluoroacetyl-CoA thioesterase
MPAEAGLSATVELTVTDADTAIALRSGDVPVLGTPRLVALVEEAAVKALAPALQAGETSVGMRVQIDHLAPIAVGSTVTAEASVEKVEGRRIGFTFNVSDASGLVAAGKITRAVVEVGPFMEKAR